MTDISQKILEAIELINGAATFDEKEIIDEVITNTTYLILPDNSALDVAQPAQVGTSINLAGHKYMEVVYLNYITLLAANVTKEKAVKIAAIRAGLISNGALLLDANKPNVARHTYRSELRKIPVPQQTSFLPTHHVIVQNNVRGQQAAFDANVVRAAIQAGHQVEFTGCIATIPANFNDFLTLYDAIPKEALQKMIKYLPIFAHMAFTKFEHHYIDNAYFKESYAKQFRSLKLTQLEPLWNHADVIYPAVHWMGPYAMKVWCDNLRTRQLMPRPLLIKFPIMPAGTAIITSTVAVLKAAGALPGFNSFYEVYDEQWKSVTDAVDAIKQNPYLYHTRADLFGLNSREKDLVEAKDSAIQLAPVAQAFINRFAAGTDLARIQAIKKHADANVGLLRRFETIFVGTATQARTAARTKPLRELLLGTSSDAAHRTPLIEAADDE